MPTTVEIPDILKKKFAKRPRIVFQPAAPGYWPIDIKFLKDREFMTELLNDREFLKNHQVVIMRK